MVGKLILIMSSSSLVNSRDEGDDGWKAYTHNVIKLTGELQG